MEKCDQLDHKSHTCKFFFIVNSDWPAYESCIFTNTNTNNFHWNEKQNDIS